MARDVFRLNPERGCEIEVWVKDDLEEIDLIMDPGKESYGSYLTSEEADSVAVALIQATPATHENAVPSSLQAMPHDARVALGIILIRSARSGK